MFSKKLRSIFSGILIIVCVCLFSGCLKNKVLVKVKKDGSGVIVVTRIFSAKIAKIIAAQSIQGGGATELINEEQIKREAIFFGTDVKFKKMKELNKADSSKGYIALYAFDDINNVKIPVNLTMQPSGKTVTFDFESDKKSISKLTVNLEKIEIPEASKNDKKEYPPHPQSPKEIQGMKGTMALADNPFNLSEKDSKEDMFRKIFADMSFSISIETAGKIVKSNASYPSKKKPSRFTLVNINFNKLMNSKKFLYDMAEAGNGMPRDLLTLMSTSSEGFKYDNQDKISVEFK